MIVTIPTDNEPGRTPQLVEPVKPAEPHARRWWVVSLAVGLVAIGVVWPLAQERICALDAWYPNGCGGQPDPRQAVAIGAIAMVVVLCATSTVLRFTVDRPRWAILACIGATVVCVAIAAIFSALPGSVPAYPVPILP